mmetsp:Transcript_21710/g.43912  ORF Transcript_21710/g.43912 Transcript_21710/m.43912 type:complete len:224 (-) Transcript_21710:1486-2157(-)
MIHHPTYPGSTFEESNQWLSCHPTSLPVLQVPHRRYIAILRLKLPDPLDVHSIPSFSLLASSSFSPLRKSYLIQHGPMLPHADEVVGGDGSGGRGGRNSDAREGVIAAEVQALEGGLVSGEGGLARFDPLSVRPIGPSQKPLVRQRRTDLHRPRHGPVPRVRHVFLYGPPKEIGRLLLLRPVFVAVAIHPLPPLVRFRGGDVSVQNVFPLRGEGRIDETGHGT